MIIIETVFWLSLFAVFYAYLGYPVFLWLLAGIISDPVKKNNIMPSVSLVISVYNEERILPRKIENALELDYPEGLLEIAIISDGSTDQTNNIIQNHAKGNSRILPCIVPTNKGKTACLNDFVPKLRGEIVLFSDANSFYERNLISNIVQPFADQRVGFVTGSTRYFTPLEGKATEATNIYSKVERLTKSLESRIGSCVGADGAVFAIRKSLFSPMNPYDINDLVIPLMIVQKGNRGVLEETAFCNEQAAEGMKGEFRRQVRITNRTLRALFNYKSLLNPFRYPIFSFEIFSHKLMKFLIPFWMVLLFMTNVILVWENHLLYKVSLIAQSLFYIVAFTKGAGKGGRFIGQLAKVCHAFVLVNAAHILGWFKYFTGETFTSWSPERKQ